MVAKDRSQSSKNVRCASKAKLRVLSLCTVGVGMYTVVTIRNV